MFEDASPWDHASSSLRWSMGRNSILYGKAVWLTWTSWHCSGFSISATPNASCMKYLPTFTIQFKPNVGKYSSPMDPMGNNAFVCFFNGNAVFWKELVIFCCIAGNKTVLCLTLLETMAISPECCSRLPLHDCALWNISRIMKLPQNKLP